MHYSTVLQLATLAALGDASKINPGHHALNNHRRYATSNGTGYSLTDEYPTGLDFFSRFSFYTDNDPTHGFVTFVDEDTATSNNMISAQGNTTYIGVDSTNVASSTGRQSVRLTSTTTYNSSLFVLDLAHMPGSNCGSWPAFWTLGANWPYQGEIDIIEGVNQQSGNAMTLHTSDGCTINNNGFSGSISTNNCFVNATGQSNNAGCGIDSTDPTSYGDGFNNNNGGVYATEWTDEFIRIFFWGHDNVPSDLTNGSPNPASWGQPVALFKGDCDIGSHFQSQNIIFDITFCGDWAGSVWSSSASCSSLSSSCSDYVQNNPSAFQSSYWLVNSLKVFSRS